MSETPRLQIAAWVVAAVLVAALAWRLLAPAGDGEPVPAVRVDSGLRARADDHSRGRVLYVHIAGAVRRPGLYRLAPGARVAAAVARAGGALRRANMIAVNLAARLQDGQQVIVPAAGAAPPLADGAAAGSPAGAAAPGAGAPKPSLSTATADQLDQLDGIGPTLARRIVEYRQAHGGFHSLDDLGQVPGIGDKRLETLRKTVQP